MTPEAAKALIDRVTHAIQDHNLPFDLCVAWEEVGAVAWSSCTDSRYMVGMLAVSDQIKGVRAAVLLMRTVLSRVPKRKTTLAAIDAAEAWADLPTEPNRSRAEKAAHGARVAARRVSGEANVYFAAAQTAETAAYREGVPPASIFRVAANVAGTAAAAIVDVDVERAADRTRSYYAAIAEAQANARAEHAAFLKQHFSAPTTDELILAAARGT